MSGGHRHYGIGDIMVLVCQMIFQDHEIKVSREFVGTSQVMYVIILPRLVPIGTLVVEICF